jgi:hypothetical protein
VENSPQYSLLRRIQNLDSRFTESKLIAKKADVSADA